MSKELTISKLSVKDTAQIVGFLGSVELHSRLVEMGFVPGVLIRLVKKSAFGGPVQLKVRDYYVSLRYADAEKIIVENYII